MAFQKYPSICILISLRSVNPDDIDFENHKFVVNLIYEFYEKEFKQHYEVRSSEFLVKEYKSFYEFEVEPEAILNIIKLNLVFLILKNDETHYINYLEVF